MPNSTEEQYTNRLAAEKSPYLLQHAHNPVDWYPWSDAAFEKARREDKPIFLSIGYSTCHWCHVMERESFEDEEVAELLNRHFVAIKVDREERPDIDSIYMSVCQTLTGHGGWPLSIFMTPEKKPFYAGTYFPKHSRHGMPGFLELLETIARLWHDKRDKLLESADALYHAVRENEEVVGAKEIEKDIAREAYHYLERVFDPVYGGFSPAPKFPNPSNLFFLLRYWQAAGSQQALKMVEHTLESMYRGGIYDHIGFGFARYSTDEKWLVPHFEKMLYDNALLALAYLEAYQAVGREFYAQVAREIFTYVLRDMQDPAGGFYTAQDADSEGEEGKFYLFKPADITAILGEEDGRLFCSYYGITKEGNFEGKSIPNLLDNSEALTDSSARSRINALREKVFAAREQRTHPYKDDKILTSWNSLMIAALAVGGRVLGDDTYTSAAGKAVTFIKNELVTPEGRLLARYRDGEAKFPAYAGDYALLIWALLELFETTADLTYLRDAIRFNRDLIKLFWDEQNGGLFLYGKDAEQLMLRTKEITDMVIPSDNAVATHNWLRLTAITQDPRLEELAERQFTTFGARLERYPMSSPFMLINYLLSQRGADRAVIVGRADDPDLADLKREIGSRFMPFVFTVFLTEEQLNQADDLPVLKQYQLENGQLTAHICRQHTCLPPLTDKAEIMATLFEQV